jgi:hypothetical protein
VTAFVITIGILNIILWIIFLAKFKKLFSTDDVIQKARSEMNSMIMDINRNAERNITLIDDRIKQLKLVTAEADRRIALAQSEEVKQASAQALRNTIGKSGPVKNTPARRAAESYKKNAVSSSRSISPDEAVQITGSGAAAAEIQNTLFSESAASAIAPSRVIVDGSDGTSFAEVPVIEPKVYFSEKPLVPKKDFNEQVMQMYDTGLSVEVIAKELGHSTTEVQFVLDMNGK